MCAHILSERTKEKDKCNFSHMFDLYPRNSREFPILFNNDELSYLEGSKAKEKMIEQ